MKMSSVKVYLKDGFMPVCLPTARHVPRDKVKAELDQMVESGVIIPVTEPTDWCSAMVPVVKKNDSLRICGTKRTSTKHKPRYERIPVEEDAPVQW